ncbi:hypothetical protein COB80_01685 [Candidatus Kaiserbacteria bacterium]|nr:MAG: hypothetical protein COB80_01685 [Candidatus Kaiserbacteria bacterium]
MSEKILVIEDDVVLRKGIITILELEGFDVIFAIDGEEGERMIREENPRMVILDLMLPKKKGVDILADLNSSKEFANIPVYVLTVVGKMDTVADCLEAGAKGYFIKPDTSLKQIAEVAKREFALKQ